MKRQDNNEGESVEKESTKGDKKNKKKKKKE